MAAACLVAAAVVRSRLIPILAAAVLVLVAGAYGTVRLGRPGEPGRSIRVALLQPNVREEERRAPGGAAATYRQVLDQGLAAAARKPDLIVVPESALPLYWEKSERLREDLQAIAARSGGRVLFNDVEERPDGSYFNVARLAGASGLIGGPYRKVHLVPFGEYVPLPKLFFFARQVSSEIGAFTAAEQAAVLDDGVIRAGVGVCYEILYPSLAREQAGLLGANLLVTISNDSWYGRAGAQAQHFAGALLRSVETNRYLLRAAITGISGIVDDLGRIRAYLPPDLPGILPGEARLLETRTAWVRWGYWIPRLADIAALAVLLSGLVRWLRFRSSG
jgi:apolipoprotein N-acyltransferase